MANQVLTSLAPRASPWQSGPGARWWRVGRASTRLRRMKALLNMVGATVGGSIGWWLGNFLGIWGAFFVSLVGTAVGVYLANRYTRSLP
jgi:hypothetical protein